MHSRYYSRMHTENYCILLKGKNHLEYNSLNCIHLLTEYKKHSVSFTLRYDHN
nr:MAG TPA: hypothetical protein [Caudoviricetes sp.]